MKRSTPGPPAPTRRSKYVPAVGPRLRKLLFVVFGLFALLAVDSAYLVGVTLAEWSTDRVYQGQFYLWMFVVHLLLGFAIVVPVIVFGIAHMRNARHRRNRRAVRVGYALFAVALLLLVSGVVLTRLEGLIEVKDPAVRSVSYWAHVAAPVAAIWLFVLHRLAGKRIRWRVAATWAAVAVSFALVMVALEARHARSWGSLGNPEGEKYFFPSLSRTASGEFIPSRILSNDSYCKQCHEDIHGAWSRSVHRFSSFNNPAYLFSIRETREVAMARDGSVARSRFCAGCHDPVPFFSGAFSDPDYDLVNDPTAHAGITCSVCHGITHINSVRGNGDYTIDAPEHYPFAFSDRGWLGWVNRQLIKAKPEFHKKTFLKPLHRTTEFCGTCHKVHLPAELNDYKWLRGQNHYDSFLLSGVSGVGVSSFYYPERAEGNCNGCHMPLSESDDFGARVQDDSGQLKVHDHFFPGANTAMPVLVDMEDADRAIESQRQILEGSVRVDLFGIREGGELGGDLTAPLRPVVPILRPGGSYLLEVVVRTVKLGHLLTQGTADSNELWLDVTVTSGERVIGRSGARRSDGNVDPWSHFVNAFVLDREGRRIDRRNAQDIFVALYNHQIPPGAADSLHYRFDIPPDTRDPVTVEVALQFRKFDATYMRLIYGDDRVKILPIVTMASDRVTFPIAGSEQALAHEPSPIEEWQRWNDYGIGLLRKAGSGELRQAEEAFREVERLGRPDGPLNRARVYIKEGRIGREAPEALRLAADHDPPPPEWSLLWFGGLVNMQNAQFDEAIRDFEQILEGRFEQAVGRGFDFSRDYRLLNELGQTLYERAKQERGASRRELRLQLLRRSAETFLTVLELDPENVTAHYNLKLVYEDLDESEKSAEHAALHARYKIDDNARDRAVAAARMRYPAANRAAEAVVIYDLQREGAYGLESPEGPDVR